MERSNWPSSQAILPTKRGYCSHSCNRRLSILRCTVSTQIRPQTYAPDWVHSWKIGSDLRWMSTMTTTPLKPAYRRGDIVLVLFPNSDCGDDASHWISGDVSRR